MGSGEDKQDDGNEGEDLLGLGELGAAVELLPPRQRLVGTLIGFDSSKGHSLDPVQEGEGDLLTTRHQDNETTRQRDNETTRQRDNETTRQRDNETTRR